jgi:hypothetical protein
MTTARAKYVEDLYLKALAAAIAVPVGTSGREPCLAIAEKIRQLHVSLITEENDKAKMPNMKLDGDASTAVARDHQNDPLRDVTDDEADKHRCYLTYASLSISDSKAMLQSFIESRRHG